jgi:hypothetical protein
LKTTLQYNYLRFNRLSKFLLQGCYSDASVMLLMGVFLVFTKNLHYENKTNRPQEIPKKTGIAKKGH